MDGSKDVYMHTSNGAKYYPFAPTPQQVELEVIAHHLACAARWAGATQHPIHEDRIFYSVAEHSVYVADYLENEMNRPDLALAGLLHDAPEAYIGDLIRPLKYSAEFKAPFKRVEDLNEEAMAIHFDIEADLKDPLIKVADDAVCHTEWLQIVPRDPRLSWTPYLHDASNKANHRITMLGPYAAKSLFLVWYQRCLKLKLIHEEIAP